MFYRLHKTPVAFRPPALGFEVPVDQDLCANFGERASCLCCQLAVALVPAKVHGGVCMWWDQRWFLLVVLLRPTKAYYPNGHVLSKTSKRTGSSSTSKRKGCDR